ncbi:MAG: diaminopropionate ammonia-lyase [Clostridia bacterium]|nr:diaminopropionate ammonia-lyase [Clostridia bacterium]
MIRCVKNPLKATQISEDVLQPFLPDPEILRYRDMVDPNPTALHELHARAEELHLGSILVKDESTRFSLKAFKGLGGVCAVFRMICEQLQIDAGRVTLEEIRSEDVQARVRQMHFVTTTDGNHGKGVAFAACFFGASAHVFLPKGSVEARRKAILEAGAAEAVVTDLSYDECARYTRALSEEKGWLLCQDTAWDGYEKVPTWIMQGYTVMVQEILQQTERQITHVFLQSGVGSMAAAVACALKARWRNIHISLVEPEGACCFVPSFERGERRDATGSGVTEMAGLNCQSISTIAWEKLKDIADAAFEVTDDITEEGMRLLGKPLPPDPAIVSGESGAVGMGLLSRLMQDGRYRDIREEMHLDDTSCVLLISTEGDTDPEHYRKVIAGM